MPMGTANAAARTSYHWFKRSMRGDDDERAPLLVGDGQGGDERLARAGGEHDDAARSRGVPGGDGALLVREGSLADASIEGELGVASRLVGVGQSLGAEPAHEVGVAHGGDAMDGVARIPSGPRRKLRRGGVEPGDADGPALEREADR